MKEISEILKHATVQYKNVVSSSSWKDIERLFKEKDNIYFCPHGGNIAIARHLASNLSRHLGWKKNIQVPDGDIVATWHGDFDYAIWLENWLKSKILGKKEKSLVIGVSSSGASPDIDRAIKWASEQGAPTAYISAQPVSTPSDVINICTNVRHYYSSEIVFMSLGMRLLNSYGIDVQPIKSLPVSNTSIEIRENSFDDELVNLGIDFDGVIHKNSKGFYDGTIYDEPIDGALKAIRDLSEKFNIIIYTCKAKPDRELIGGKTGAELVWEWLEKYSVAEYVDDVTSEKPRAVAYIDDKAIKFDDWQSCLKEIGN
jgi:phosphoheptose isomerase